MKLFCVVGMHRSGTSAVSGMLNILGASLGPSSDLMEPKSDNPTGFWESRSVSQLHDDLLGQLGGRWDNPKFHDDGWEFDPSLEPFRNRIQQLIATHFAGTDIAVWKDPRGSILLPIWRTVTRVSGSILTLRDPFSVARSLSTRQNITPEKAAILWLRYVGAAHRADPGRFVVDYGQLIFKPREFAIQLADFVGLPAPSEEQLRRIEGFVRADLCHQPGFTESAAGSFMRLAWAVHEIFVGEKQHIIGPIVDVLHDRWKAMSLLDTIGSQSRRLLSDLLPRE